MIEVDILLKNLRSDGVRFYSDGSNLRIDAPKGHLTPEVKKLLRDHKADIVRRLKTDRNPFNGESKSGLRIINYFDSFNRTSGKRILFDAPTIEAYEAEVSLCAAVLQYEIGSIDDAALKQFIDGYLGTHTNRDDFSKAWTGGDVPLYHIQLFLNGERVKDENYTCNIIQTWIMEALWLKQNQGHLVEIQRIRL